MKSYTHLEPFNTQDLTLSMEPLETESEGQLADLSLHGKWPLNSVTVFCVSALEKLSDS